MGRGVVTERWGLACGHSGSSECWDQLRWPRPELAQACPHMGQPWAWRTSAGKFTGGPRHAAPQPVIEGPESTRTQRSVTSGEPRGKDFHGDHLDGNPSPSTMTHLLPELLALHLQELSRCVWPGKPNHGAHGVLVTHGGLWPSLPFSSSSLPPL